MSHCSLARALSHQGLLQPCCTLAVRCPVLPACLCAAPMRRELELRLFLSSLTGAEKGCRISFPEFRLLDQYTGVLHRVHSPGGSHRTTRGQPSSVFNAVCWQDPFRGQRNKTHTCRSVANNIHREKINFSFVYISCERTCYLSRLFSYTLLHDVTTVASISCAGREIVWQMMNDGSVGCFMTPSHTII